MSNLTPSGSTSVSNSHEQRARSIQPAMTVDQLVPAIGAEIGNVDLCEVARNDDLFGEVKSLLHQHKVLFFRDQALPPADHVALAERFGPTEGHPVQPSYPDFPTLLRIHRQSERSTYENIWHSDASFRAAPPMGAVLKCEECPPVGGDTMWANMALAYERLSDRIKEHVRGLVAQHSIEHSFGGAMSPEKRAALVAENPPSNHPVVRTHPETREEILYVNQGFTTHFVNFQRFDRIRVGQDFTLESNNLMNYLLAQAEIPEYQVRLRWRPGTVALWDNRVCQHYAVHDYWPAPRKMSRATIVGDRPF
jgi:taurine dioxygenase